ncbi:MAG TPA: PAS domain-containing protein [Stellaceae bacterium]|nr:PAS domain-containing protein [Stellaceae bacterium]
MISQLASSFASYALVAVAYASFGGLMRRATPRQRQIAVGAMLGAAALVSALAQRYSGEPLPVGDDVVVVGLAAGFGGGLASITAGLIAAGAFLGLGSGPAYHALPEILVAGAIGVAVTKALQREDGRFGLKELAALALSLTLGAAALAAPALAASPAETIAALVGRVLFGTLALGILLLRLDEAEGRTGESRRRWRALVANVPGAVVQITATAAGELSFAFDTADGARLFGEGTLGSRPDATRVLQSIHPNDRVAFRRSLVDAGHALSPWSHEFRVVLAGGRQRWLSGRAMPFRKPNGDILWDAIVINVTSRKEAEQALRGSEALYRLLAENTTEILGRIGADEAWNYLSPSVRDILGYDPRELVGRPWLGLVEAADAARAREVAASLVPGGSPITFTYRIRHKDGPTLWVEETRRLVGRNGDERFESISVLRPLDSKRAAVLVGAGGAAGDDQPQFLRMLEAATAGVIVVDPHRAGHPVVFANEAAAAITGSSREELLAGTSEALAGAGANAEIAGEIAETVRQQRPLSTTFLSRRKDGAPYWAKLDFSPVRDAQGRVDAFVGIFFDISEQKRVETELRRARDAAEEANQAKSEFIANISHELRTPLNGVIGFTNLLLNENLPAEQRRYASFARDAGSSLLAIINNILDLAKIEAGKLTLVEADFSVIELAVSCNTVVWHAARERGLDLNFVLKPDVLSLVRGDPDRIRQVLLNLLSNAIKFTEKGSVVLTVAKVEDRPSGTVLRFSVTDTGIGIAKEQQSRLFQKFSQIEDKAGVYLRGTGLGLAICKNLVEGMGGAIGITSTSGVGSNFWFTVPLKSPAGAEKPVEAKAGASRGARILLVEDTPMNQELMLTLLRRAGHAVDVAGDGEAAVEAVRHGAFDLVLMDVQLPRLDGLAATRAIRQLGTPAARAPIIAMTARALPGDAERCLAAGMSDHLSKPVDAAALLATIDRWVNGERSDGAETPAAPNAAPQVQDRAVLRDLEAHLGQRKLDELVARARAELPRVLGEMRQHRSAPKRLEREAHELVSIAGTAGLQELVECARALMEVCQAGNDAEIAAKLAATADAGERALAALAADNALGAE